MTPTAASSCAGSLSAVASARWLWRLAATLGLLAAAAVTLASASALRAVHLDGGALATLLATCRSYLLPDLRVASIAVVALAGLGVAVLVLGARALARELTALARFRRGVRVSDRVRVGGRVVQVVADPVARAFCAGWMRPRVYVSQGAIDELEADELRAVVAHEDHHARRRDPLRLLVIAVLADALFFMPVMRRLRERYAQLAELDADEAARRAVGAQPLAAALMRFGETTVPGVVVGIAPERVDALLGQPPRWQLSLSLLSAAIVSVAAIAVTALATASSIPSDALSGSQLAAQACMLAMTLGPVLLGCTMLLGAARTLRARR